MIWQDVPSFIIAILFAYSLWPTVFKGFREKKVLIARETGILTALGLIVSIYINYTLGLIITPLITSITCLGWCCLIWQTFIY